MSDNYENMDSEQIIFRDGFATFTLEPSEHFWKRAYEDILLRQERTNKYHELRWRSAFIIMGAVIVFLSSYALCTRSGMNDIKLQLTKMDSVRVIAEQKEVRQNIGIKSLKASLDSVLSKMSQGIKYSTVFMPSSSVSSINNNPANTFVHNQNGGSFNSYFNTLSNILGTKQLQVVKNNIEPTNTQIINFASLVPKENNSFTTNSVLND